MTPQEPPDRQRGLFLATHLDITIDPNNPPPAASESFPVIRQKAKAAWESFEAAENRLVRLDEDVYAEFLNYISSHHRATTQERQTEKARLAVPIYEPRIAEAESCCRELEMASRALEEAALKEPETVEARATLRIDLKVIKDSLATTHEIIRVAQSQLVQFRTSLTHT